MRISDWSSDVCSSDLRAAYDASIAGWPAGASDRPASAGAAAVAEPPEDDIEFEGRFDDDLEDLLRSEERRVGKECVRPCRARWATDPENKKKTFYHLHLSSKPLHLISVQSSRS